MDDRSGLAWPLGRLADAVEALAHASGVARPSSSQAPVKRDAQSTDPVDSGVERLSRQLRFESESFDVAYGALERTLMTAGPAIFTLSSPNGADGHAFLALLGCSSRTATLLAPGGRRVNVPFPTLAAWLRQHLDETLTPQIDPLLAETGIPAERRDAARVAMLAARLGSVITTKCWLLRPAPEAPLWQHMRHARVPRRLVLFVAAYAGTSLASLGSWWLIGAAALEGRFDPGSLLAWTFLLLSLVPLTLMAMWSQAVFVLGAGGILKLRLMAGALKLDPDDIRHQGVGQHLARVIESESVEGLALAGGVYAIAACFDLALAGLVLMLTTRSLPLVLLLAMATFLMIVAAMYFRSRERWTAMRMRLTHDLVEQMVGHRTRLVQESPIGRHRQEDASVEVYLEASTRMDRLALVLSVVPRVWLFIGLIALAPQLVSAGSTPAALAVSLGATMLAFTALGKMTASVSTLVDAAIGWRQVEPLLEALRTPESLGHVDALEPLGTIKATPRGALVVAQDLAYRFRDRMEPVLQHCSFRILAGDRIHLTGVSGGGKSTLVSLLTGLRVPDAGFLLLDGLDRATLGAKAWKRRVGAAPQFHENHLFNDTLAFNLLMGRRWPPSPDDLRWADTVCRRLGLGDLLDRMPGGLFQIVGETGWQLSHGERSRVYMARALLQGGELVILDESFAELDPVSLSLCLREATHLAPSLVVVAHA
jgi:ATP-binding cassette subfamily B protein